MEEDRSKTGIVHSALDVKSWLARPPTVDEARPGRCPSCATPSRRPGCALGIWGHGVRQRRLEGPPAPGEEPVDLVLATRRYVCQACGAVLLVVPRGVARWRHYTTAAIAWALALWGLEGRPVAEVRRRTSTTATPAGFGEPRRWASLRRWVSAAVRGELFAQVRLGRPAAAGSPRGIAAQVARVLAGHALSSLRHLPLAVQVFLVGAQMA